ncbi:MAG: amidohydrolase family protein, partial [Clostridia bacterium]|nr:amidohydrolase family protein [Clostridia bacterium]
MKKILYNAKVYVEQNVFEEAVLVDGGYIEAVGKNDEILALKDDDTELIDCEGKTLIPGLNDSHLHFMQFGETLNQVNIEGVTSIDEMVERCQDFLAKYPEKCKNGMHAIGWNQDYFVDGDRLPNRHDLDRISTDFPIVLERVCGHIVSSNTKAIEILGIDGDSPQFPDGEFLIGEDGYPNGIYTANACNVVK